MRIQRDEEEDEEKREIFSFRLRENLYDCVISVPAVSIRFSFTRLNLRIGTFLATFITR